MPRFCFVMPFHIAESRGGGAEVQAWLLAKELAGRGFETSYVAQSVNGKAGRIETIDGVTVRWVRYAHHFRWANAPDYWLALSALAPEIVVQRGASVMTGVIALWCRRHGARFAWMCSDNAMPDRWMHWRAQRRANARLRPAPHKRAVLLANALVADLSRRWGMRHVTWAFTQNDEQERGLRQQFGLASQRMISGHAMPERVVPAETRLKDGIVLWVGNLGSNKRPELFVDLARRSTDPRLRFVMIGGHADAHRIEEVFRDKPANLAWLGRLPFEDTLSWFDRAFVFVNTSISEGFPNTFIQAWLRGVPVLTLGVDPDGVIAGQGLGIVDHGLDGLEETLTALRDSPDTYRAMSDRARDHALSRHGVESAAQHLVSQLLAAGRQRAIVL